MSGQKCKHCGAIIRPWTDRWIAVADSSELCPSGSQVQFATRHEPYPPVDLAELLRLLERHHAESMTEDNLLPAGEGARHYIGSELCLLTIAAIKRAKPPVPVWRCPVCGEKCLSRDAIDAHRKEMNHGPETSQP